MSITTRIRQTVQVVLAWGSKLDDSPARMHLRPAEYALFQRLSRAERGHHLRVYHDLVRHGHTNPALLRAALLHDVGKTRYRFALPSKVLVVVVKALAPRSFERWSAGSLTRWNRPFMISAQHPTWGAQMCAAIGMEDLAVELIRRHQEHIEPPFESAFEHLLYYLQQADDRS